MDVSEQSLVLITSRVSRAIGLSEAIAKGPTPDACKAITTEIATLLHDANNMILEEFED